VSFDFGRLCVLWGGFLWSHVVVVFFFFCTFCGTVLKQEHEGTSSLHTLIIENEMFDCEFVKSSGAPNYYSCVKGQVKYCISGATGIELNHRV